MPEEWHPTNEEVEVLDSAWKQVKVECKKIKEQTTATENIFQKYLTK